MKKIKITLFLTLIANLQISFAQIAPDWETTINGNGDFGDNFKAVVVDANNNFYVAGYTVNSNTDRDLLVAKFNSNAQLQWKKIFAGTGNGPDEGKKILLHPNGNVVICGYLNNRSVGNDFFTAMIKPTGDTVWTRSFNSPSTNLYDEPNAISIDGQGNIIVVGDSDNDPSPFVNNDYLTVKYSSSGTLLWSVRYNSSANDNDRALALATDVSNNVYVTGRVFNSKDDDYVTIKYNASGTQQWLKSYDNGGTDRPTSIGVDQNGLIYVVGRSSNGTDDDFKLVVYNNLGAQQFTAFYDVAGHDRPIDMVVIPKGGCVITGRCDGNPSIGIDYDIHTVAFSSTGTKIWSGVFAGTALNDDIPTSIRLGSNGNVLVSGYSDADNTANILNDVVFLQFSSTGALQIKQIYKGSPDFNDEGFDLAQMPNGNVVIVGNSSDAKLQTDALCMIYNGNKAPIYSSLYKGLGDNNENVRNMVIDPQGKVYFCGYSVNRNLNRDFSYGCIDDKGAVIWKKDTSGTLFGSDEEANAIAIDPSSNIIVSGYLKNSGTSSDLYLEKVNPQGVRIWNFAYDSPFHESDRTNDMVVNTAGDIYLVGKSDVDQSWLVNDDILVMKVSSAGSLLWKTTYAASSLIDRAQFVKLTSKGDVIVAGILQNGINDNVIVLKYGPTGTLIWSKVFDYQGANDKLNDLLIDLSDNIYLVGQAQKQNGSSDYNAFVACVNQAGQQVWVNFIGKNGLTMDEAVSISLAKDNTLWVAGNIDSDTSSTVNLDVFLKNYDNTGKDLTPNLLQFGGTNSDEADDIVMIDGTTPCIAMHSNTSTTGDIDFAMNLLEYKNNQWVSSYQRNISDTIDVANTIRWQSSTKFLYVGGSTYSKTGQRDMLLGKYHQGVVGVKNQMIKSLQVFPNPCKDLLTIQSNISREIHIFNSNGSEMFVSDDLELNAPLTINIADWPQGLYFAVFSNSNTTQSIKIIKN